MNPTVGDLDESRGYNWLREVKKQRQTWSHSRSWRSPAIRLKTSIKATFYRDNRRALHEVVRHCRGLAALWLCQPERWDRSETGRSLVGPQARTIYNAAAVIADQKLITTIASGTCRTTGCLTRAVILSRPAAAAHPSARYGGRVNICEESGCRKVRPVSGSAGAEVIVNINALRFIWARAGHASRCWQPARGKNGVVSPTQRGRRSG